MNKLTPFVTHTARALASRLCYWLGLTELFYWLNKGAKRIITFHNVLPDELMNGLPIAGCMDTATDFKQMIAEMGRRFEFSTDISDTHSATITFDDGLVSQYEVAGEILRSKGIPAIVFVAGDAIEATPETTLVTDRLIAWTYFAPDSAVKAAFGEVIPRASLWVKHVQPAYRADWQSRGRLFLAKLDEICPVKTILASLPPEWVRLRFSGMTKRQLDDLRRRGWKIGWHTRSHFPLGMLDYAGKREELSSPKEYRQVVVSYPYGDIGSVGKESLVLAKELGYPCAVSNEPEYSKDRGRFFMMRMALSPDKYELHFVLSGLKYFIKYKKLLPSIKSKHAK